METIGFIGLGIMGGPMAGHLLDAGYSVVTSNHRGAPRADLVAKGLKAVAGNKAVAQAADIIITIVPDTPDVADVLFGGEDSLAAGLSAGKLVIDMSSISPIETKEFAAKIEALGADYLDAPVSGGEVGAKAASLSIMCGGKPEVFERARQVLEKMGKNITLVGPVGSGQTAKVANQIVVALTIEAVAEALVFASKAGADPAKVRQALMGGLATSRILEVHGERMIKRTFDPGFRIDLHRKDLNLALDGARALGIALPNTSTTQQLFNACAANGGGKDDHSGLVKALELMAGHAVA
ncbi:MULTISPECIES: 2-hydroxy-3-oxopropionate reductase [Mesorhizobium]|uniref:2-hydroxy-3-oxopropionate reductase n=1 Tax=Mesorhizobium denitrificans TaxID=2294114 RepID=A0A371X943_9HYPH|nr:MULTISPECIES: 2-hydroxy-3-oxopropionate reductase [Mesorhizobium]RFC65733.1 2-hydroxy-3-oxopropionate reductase [Mesorhizobium denitrificans]